MIDSTIDISLLEPSTLKPKYAWEVQKLIGEGISEGISTYLIVRSILAANGYSPLILAAKKTHCACSSCASKCRICAEVAVA